MAINEFPDLSENGLTFSDVYAWLRKRGWAKIQTADGLRLEHPSLPRMNHSVYEAWVSECRRYGQEVSVREMIEAKK